MSKMMRKALIGLRRLSIVLRKIPGLVLLLEPVRKAFAVGGRIIDIADFDGRMRMRLRLDEHMQSQIFWYGYYSRDIVLVLNRILEPGNVVVDAGANVGELSLVAAHRVGSSGRVYSFEPMTTMYDQLVQHIELNRLDQVVPIKKGLADVEKSAMIYAQRKHFKDGTSHEGLGTVYPFADRCQPVEEIQLTTLDKYLVQHGVQLVDLIKIDVEGSEFDVLRGAKETLRRCKPFVILELQTETAQSAGRSAEDMIGFIESLGFRIFIIGRKGKLRPLGLDNVGRFQNVLCVAHGKRFP